MSKQSLGIIEIIGLAPAIVGADISLKSANVKLIGYELTKGSGMTVIKIEGEVGAVTAAVSAVKAELDKYNSIWSIKVIARPSEGIEFLTRNDETVGYDFIHEIDINSGSKNINKEIEELEEKKNSIIEKEQEDILLKEDTSENEITCNLCHDAECPRKKGDLRKKCIHYDEIEI